MICGILETGTPQEKIQAPSKASEKNWHMVRLLLCFGANPLQKNSSGEILGQKKG